MLNRHRVLVISENDDLRSDLVTLLSGYGYFVEDFKDRLEGVRQFRAHKQSIIILDIPVLRRFSKRIFALIKMVQKNAVILIAAKKEENSLAFKHLRRGAYDILNLPLKTEFLIQTIERAQNHHKAMLENMFIKNILFMGILMSPIWLLTLFLLLKSFFLK